MVGFSKGPMAMATRGGGFHKPDPVPYSEYKNTRRHHVEDMNTTFYSDIAPEFHMHLHSIQIQTGKAGWFLISCFFLGIICPCWVVAQICHRNMGSNMFPSVRPGPDHAHMAPKLIAYLKENNYEKKADKFGRRNAEFYANTFKQEMGPEFKPSLIRKFNWLGFSYWGGVDEVDGLEVWSPKPSSHIFLSPLHTQIKKIS